MSGYFLLIYICNFHVLSHFLLIYICKLHWNQGSVLYKSIDKNSPSGQLPLTAARKLSSVFNLHAVEFISVTCGSSFVSPATDTKHPKTYHNSIQNYHNLTGNVNSPRELIQRRLMRWLSRLGMVSLTGVSAWSRSGGRYLTPVTIYNIPEPVTT